MSNIIVKDERNNKSFVPDAKDFPYFSMSKEGDLYYNYSDDGIKFWCIIIENGESIQYNGLEDFIGAIGEGEQKVDVEILVVK